MFPLQPFLIAILSFQSSRKINYKTTVILLLLFCVVIIIIIIIIIIIHVFL